MPRLTPANLAEWRLALVEEGDGEFLDPTTAQAIVPRLMAEVEALWAERNRERVEALRAAALFLEKRLGDVAEDGGTCRACMDGEARGFLFKLRAIADGRIYH